MDENKMENRFVEESRYNYNKRVERKGLYNLNDVIYYIISQYGNCLKFKVKLNFDDELPQKWYIKKKYAAEWKRCERYIRDQMDKYTISNILLNYDPPNRDVIIDIYYDVVNEYSFLRSDDDKDPPGTYKFLDKDEYSLGYVANKRRTKMLASIGDGQTDGQKNTGNKNGSAENKSTDEEISEEDKRKIKKSDYLFNDIELDFLMSRNELMGYMKDEPEFQEKARSIMSTYRASWKNRTAPHIKVDYSALYSDNLPYIDGLETGMYILPEKAIMSKALLDIPLILERFRWQVLSNDGCELFGIRPEDILFSDGNFIIKEKPIPPRDYDAMCVEYQRDRDLLVRLDLMFKSLFLAFYTPIDMEKVKKDLDIIDARDFEAENDELNRNLRVSAELAMRRLEDPVGNYFKKREPLKGEDDRFSAGVRFVVGELLKLLKKQAVDLSISDVANVTRSKIPRNEVMELAEALDNITKDNEKKS